MKKLKSFEEFKAEGLELQKNQLKTRVAGLAYTPDPIISYEGGGDSFAETSYYQSTTYATGPDRLRCAKQDNPNLPGYDPSACFKCVNVPV